MQKAPTHEVIWTVDDAIAFLRGEQAHRSQSWHQACLSLAAHAYGFSASGTVDTDNDGDREAIEYWEQSAFQHPDDKHPPVGGLACWKSKTAGRAGHIAVVTESGPKGVFVLCNDMSGDVSRFELGSVEGKFSQIYQGWAEPNFPNGAPGNPFGQPEVSHPTVVFRQALFLGNEDSDSVRTLQRRLADLVDPGLEATGSYDKATRQAVRQFQRRCGFSGDGADGLIFDAERKEGGLVTTRMLFPAEAYVRRDGPVPKPGPTPDPVAEPEEVSHPARVTGLAGLPVVDPDQPETDKPKVALSDLVPGLENESVRRLQLRLNRVNNAGLDVNSRYDDATVAAVRAWQLQIGDLADADGRLGPKQFARLFPLRAFERVDDPPAELTLSPDGEDFVIEFEGFRKDLYNDQAGHCSIGVGHLVHFGNCDGSESKDFRNGITRDQAIELMRADAASKIDAVASNVKVALTQEQFDALVSFTFNVGEANFESSTLLTKLNKGKLDEVPDELARWNKVTVNGRKVVSKGLTRRRGREGTLFATGSYTG